MHTHIRRTISAGVMAGGFTVLGLTLATSPASADSTSGGGGLLSGNQTGLDVTAPVHVAGQQVNALGNGNKNSASSKGNRTPSVSPGHSGNGSTDGSRGTGSGNQTDAGVAAPVGASGNQATVLGDRNDNASGTPSGSTRQRRSASAGSTSGEDGTAAGNQTAVGADVPIEACGNQVTVIGSDNQSNGCSSTSSTATTPTGDGTTSGAQGIGSGNQVWLGLLGAVNAGGNQITVIGDGNQSNADGTDGTATAASAPAGSGDTTSGEQGIGSGNQVNPTAGTPVNAAGNQITVIGDGNNSSADGTDGTATAASAPAGSGDTTSGEQGIGSGNQIDPSLGAPVDTTGNQVTVLGDGNVSRARSTNSGAGDPEGNDSAGNGLIGDVDDESGDQTGDPSSNSSEDSTNDGSGLANVGGDAGQAQAAAAPGSGSLPSELADTGAASGLLQWLVLGFLLLATGMILILGRGLGLDVPRRHTGKGRDLS